jgi:hypothetical protein
VRPEYDPTDIQQQQRDKAEEQAKKRLAQMSEEDDFKWLMSSRRGRRIVWRLLEQAGVFHISFSQNSMQMAFNEGRRNYGNKILNQIHLLCPELYPAMLKEATHGNRTDDRNADHSN